MANAAFVAGVAPHLALGGWWILVVPLLLLPDVSMIGYLRGPGLGVALYNLVHRWTIGLLALGVGVGLDLPWLALAGAVLVAHAGMDRALGYGLRYPTSFQYTYLAESGRDAATSNSLILQAKEATASVLEPVPRSEHARRTTASASSSASG